MANIEGDPVERKQLVAGAYVERVSNNGDKPTYRVGVVDASRPYDSQCDTVRVIDERIGSVVFSLIPSEVTE